MAKHGQRYKNHRHLLGNLPRLTEGINKTKLDRAKVAEQFNFSIEQIHKVYNIWVQIFTRQPNSTLTFEEYLLKIKEAGITPEQVGCSLEKYQLARFNDEGPYTKDSCRFITFKENKKEQKVIPIFTSMVKKYGYDYAIEHCRKNGLKRRKSNV